MDTSLTETTTPEPTAAIDAKIEAAQATLERLREAATKAAEEAERAKTAFEREPTPQAHSAQAVAFQKTSNAHAAADVFERGELAELQAARQAIIDDRDREVLGVLLDPARLGRVRYRIAAAIIAAHREIQDATREAIVALADRRQHQLRASSLGIPVPDFRFESILAGALADVLAAFPNTQTGRTHTVLRTGNTGNTLETFVRLEANVAAQIPVNL